MITGIIKPIEDAGFYIGIFCDFSDSLILHFLRGIKLAYGDY